MELTRRDAIAALAVGGVGMGVTSAFLAEDRRRADDDCHDGEGAASALLGDHELETLVAVALVVYPSEVTGIDAFVRSFVRGRAADRPDHAADVVTTIDRLDELGQHWHGAPVAELESGTRAGLLSEVGADTADADPEGTLAERVRYFLVNELLFALYASPTGGELVGIENPQGHAGGLDSYRRGPRR